MIHFITSNNHPSNPQQPIHSLRKNPPVSFYGDSTNFPEVLHRDNDVGRSCWTAPISNKNLVEISKNTIFQKFLDMWYIFLGNIYIYIEPTTKIWCLVNMTFENAESCPFPVLRFEWVVWWWFFWWLIKHWMMENNWRKSLYSLVPI